jgi:DNA replication protein DnaC
MDFEDLSRRMEATLIANGADLERRKEEAAVARTASYAKWRVNQMEKIGIPAAFRELGESGDVKDTEALVAARLTGTGVVVLSGKPGCGKSAAACVWLREAFLAKGAEDRYPSFSPYGDPPCFPLFVTSARLSRWERYDNAQMDKLLKADRLVVDDVGAEFADAKGNFNAILDELVSDRHANRRPLVMTTNLDATAFKARYDERIADRIREVGRFVSLDGPSMRKRAVT